MAMPYHNKYYPMHCDSNALSWQNTTPRVTMVMPYHNKYYPMHGHGNTLSWQNTTPWVTMAMPYHNKYYPMHRHGNALSWQNTTPWVAMATPYHNKHVTSILPSTLYSIHGNKALRLTYKTYVWRTIVWRKVVYNLRLTYETYVWHTKLTSGVRRKVVYIPPKWSISPQRGLEWPIYYSHGVDFELLDEGL